MVISVDAENFFDKIQHPFKIKTLQKVGIEGNYLIIRPHTTNPQQTILSGEKLKAFRQRPGTRQGAHSHHYYLTLLWKSSHSNQRRNKRNHIGKEVKLSADEMILYIENAKDSTRKFLELINEYSSLSVHRNPLHFCTGTMKNQKEKLRKQSHSLLQQKE